MLDAREDDDPDDADENDEACEGEDCEEDDLLAGCGAEAEEEWDGLFVALACSHGGHGGRRLDEGSYQDEDQGIEEYVD